MAINTFSGFPQAFNSASCGWQSALGSSTSNNISNATVENYKEKRGSLWGGYKHANPVKGYALDLNKDGRFNRAQDGTLAFDLNHDGRVGHGEIKRSRGMLKAFGNDFDFNGDGKVGPKEARRGEQLRARALALDTNHDGVLDRDELGAAGARVLVDRNRDGNYGPGESHTVYDFPTPGLGRGQLDYVDPAHNLTSTSVSMAGSR